MIKGKRKSALVWSSKAHGGARGRLHIETKTYDDIINAIDRKLFRNENVRKLDVSKKGKYKYEPSEKYKKFLSNLHKVPTKRVNLNQLSVNY
jgi:hypothetical protein